MTSGRRLGIVTGLPAEARAAGGAANIRILCGDASPARARTHAQTLAAWGAGGLASFGVAGGLDPRLRPGAVVLATKIVVPGGDRLPVDERWANRLAAALAPALPVIRAPLAGADAPLADTAAKAALAASSGAAAVDMESHVVAQAGLPVIALRAVADPAGRDLPASALVPSGQLRTALFRRPGDLASLLALAMDYRRALAAMRRVVWAVGPDLAFFADDHRATAQEAALRRAARDTLRRGFWR